MSAFFNAGVSLAELPFAIAFDNYSNKLSLQLGSLLRLVAFAIFFLDGNIYWILVGQALAGVGFAASSGASEALMLNDIPQGGEGENKAMLLGYSRITFITSVSALVVGIIGIFSFALMPSSIWLLAISFFACSVVSLAFLENKKVCETKIPLKEFIFGLRRIFKVKSVYLTLLANSAAVAPFILWQIKIGSQSLGYLYAGFIAMKFFAALAAQFLKNITVSPVRLYAICLYNVICIYLFAQTDNVILSVIFFGLHIFGQVLLTIICYGKLHSEIDNSIRASATSIVSLMDSLVVVAVAPLAGYLATHYSTGTSMLLSVAFYVLFSLCVVFLRQEFTGDGKEPIRS